MLYIKNSEFFTAAIKTLKKYAGKEDSVSIVFSSKNYTISTYNVLCHAVALYDKVTLYYNLYPTKKCWLIYANNEGHMTHMGQYPFHNSDYTNQSEWCQKVARYRGIPEFYSFKERVDDLLYTRGIYYEREEGKLFEFSSELRERLHRKLQQYDIPVPIEPPIAHRDTGAFHNKPYIPYGSNIEIPGGTTTKNMSKKQYENTVNDMRELKRLSRVANSIRKEEKLKKALETEHVKCPICGARLHMSPVQSDFIKREGGAITTDLLKRAGVECLNGCLNLTEADARLVFMEEEPDSNPCWIDPNEYNPDDLEETLYEDYSDDLEETLYEDYSDED